MGDFFGSEEKKTTNTTQRGKSSSRLTGSQNQSGSTTGITTNQARSTQAESALPVFLNEARGTLSSLVNIAEQGELGNNEANKFLTSLLGEQGEVNPITSDLADSIRTNSERRLRNRLADIRSEFKDSPIGRTQIAMDNAIGNNLNETELGILNLLNDQFNQDRSTRLSAANQLNQNAEGANEIGLRLLQLMRGQEQIGQEQATSDQVSAEESVMRNVFEQLARKQFEQNTNSTTTVESQDSAFNTLLAVAGAAAGVMSGGSLLPVAAGILGGLANSQN